jgi:hypothetical protein
MREISVLCDELESLQLLKLLLLLLFFSFLYCETSLFIEPYELSNHIK